MGQHGLDACVQPSFFLDPDTLPGARIATGSHCFGCTAGHGSSCGGNLT